MNHETLDLRGHDLNLFVVFAVLMEERNVTRTASRLHMSQAAVSASLKRLRRSFEDELFIRAPGGMSPTVKAQQMHRPILRGLEAMRIAIEGNATFDPLTDHFVLRLGMSDDLEAAIMPALIDTASSTGPGSSLYCVQTTRLKIVELLETGQADAGVTASTAWGSHVRSRTLFESGYACLHDPKLVGHSRSLSHAEYLAIPHVMISSDGTRGIVDDVLEAEGISRRIVTSTAHFAMVPYLLSRVPSVATMPRHVAELFAEQFGMTVSAPPIDLPRFSASVVWHQARDQDPQVQWLVATLESLAARMGPF